MHEKYTYDFPRPNVTVDIVLLRVRGERLETLLVKRGKEPHKGACVFPGGFVDIDEPVAHAAARELHEETGVQNVVLEAFAVFDAPERDPRGRTISVAHIGLVPDTVAGVKAGDDAADAGWFAIGEAPKLGFDHEEMLNAAIAWLADRLGLLRKEPPWSAGAGSDEKRALKDLIGRALKARTQP